MLNKLYHNRIKGSIQDKIWQSSSSFYHTSNSQQNEHSDPHLNDEKLAKNRKSNNYYSDSDHSYTHRSTNENDTKKLQNDENTIQFLDSATVDDTNMMNFNIDDAMFGLYTLTPRENPYHQHGDNTSSVHVDATSNPMLVNAATSYDDEEDNITDHFDNDDDYDNQSIDIVKLLIDAKANLNLQNNDGENAASYC